MKKLIFIPVASMIVWSLFYFKSKSENQLSTRADSEIINPENHGDAFKRKSPTRAVVSETDPETYLDQKIDENPSTLLEQTVVLKESVTDLVHYEVEKDGLVTVDGDIVLGAGNDGGVVRGQTQTSEFNLWPSAKVPFFIQGDFEQPERVIKALAMFVDTPIQFVPYQGEEDVLVFQSTSMGCKSYLGKIGGKQPVWISPQCGVTEITHEIMHALGFIHEQNRSDRDIYIDIQWDNIIESKKINFELFPGSLMKVSGRAPFDFQSIMLYPPNMFSKNGHQTMNPVNKKNEISPSHGLSSGDLLRLANAYSN